VKELGEIDMVSMAPEPPGTGTESWLQQPPQRTHECGADGRLPDALRELLG
jgi:hypothetical protein